MADQESESEPYVSDCSLSLALDRFLRVSLLIVLFQTPGREHKVLLRLGKYP